MEDSSIRDHRTTTRTIALGVPASIGHEDRQTRFAEIEIDQASTLALLPVQRGGLDRLSQNIVNSQLSRVAVKSLEDAIQNFNTKVPAHKSEAIVDKRTKFAALVKAAQKELVDHCSEEVAVKGHRKLAWRKVKHALEKFCKTIYAYSAVMDVLVSSHPEIASLAWGAIKFLLAVGVNHQELKEKIFEHLAEIGEQFKIIDQYVRVFPEAEMVDHVLGAYTDFLTFLQLSIDWCRETGFVKFFKNVAQPYGTRIRPTIDSLKNHIRRIDARTGFHNTNGIATVQLGTRKVHEDVMDVKDFFAAMNGQLQVQSSTSDTVLDLLRSIVRAKTPVTSNESLGDILPTSDLKLFKSEYTVKANFFPELLCAPSHLQHTWIACQRLDSHKSHGAMKLAEKPEIKAWIRSEASALLWIDGFSEPHVAKWTTEFSVDVFMAANEARATVLYYFGELSMEGIGDVATEYLSSPRAVLHSFITQLVQQHPDLVGQHPQWFTSSIFQSTRVSMKTSWALFKKIIGVVAPEVPLYIILDNLDTIGELSSDSREFGSLVRKMSRLVSEQRQTPIKIILSSVTNSVLNQYIRDGPAHIILRVPQTFGRSAIVQTPPHMAKKTPKRLVRLPDSDSGFGMKPSDSFDISEDEGRDSCEFLSSSSETACQASLVSRDLKTQHPTIEGQRCSGVKSKSIPRPRSGSPSDSSSLSFSDSESETRHSQNTEDKDIEFSSEESGSA